MKRRDFLHNSALLLSFSIAGQTIIASPAEAKGRSFPLQTLSPKQAQTAELLGETIAPGALKAGVSQYLDQQLSVEDDIDCLLMIRYLGVPTPYKNFYIPALDAAAQAAQEQFSLPIEKLSAEQLEEFVGLMASDQLPNWQGPPGSFFYFVFRADAIDVTYGTQEAFAQQGIPYMAHITPTRPW